MLVYTYCSYRGGHKGYQYAFFDTSKDTGGNESMLSMENTETIPDGFMRFFGDVQKTMIHHSNCKVILKKYNESHGILFIFKIEEALEFLRQQRLDKIEEEKSREEFFGEKRNVHYPLEDKLEADFFVNVAFVGDMETLRIVAAHYIADLLYSNPPGNIWMKRIENILAKTSDRERYEINLLRCREFADHIKDWGEKQKKGIRLNSKANAGSSRMLKSRRRHPLFCTLDPYVRLKKEECTRLQDRKKRVEEEIINRLLQQEKFSEKYILVVDNSCGGHLPMKEEVNMVFDMDYIK